MYRIKQVDINNYLKDSHFTEKGKQTRRKILENLKGIDFNIENIEVKFNKLYKNNKESTRNTYKKYINHFINYINDRYECNIGTLKQIIIRTHKAKIITYDEFTYLLNQANKKYRDIIFAQYILGTRAEELRLIKWEDIQDKEFINIVFKGKEKTIFFPSSLKHLATKHSGKILQVHYTSYNNYLKKLSMNLLNKEVTTHALRHLRASRLEENGIKISTIKELLGHESIVTTQRYLHNTKEKLIKALEII